jgi:hypothetical protein
MARQSLSMLLLQAARHASRARVCFGTMYATGAQCSCRFASTVTLKPGRSTICRLQHDSGMRTSFASHKMRARIHSVGEHATGACIGTHYLRLPCGSRLRLRRRVALVRQSFPALRARFVEEVSPVFHHRLKFKNGLSSGTTHRARLGIGQGAL